MDRRGSLWVYEYDANANLRTFDDPLLHRRTFVFEAGTRNLLSYKDALNNEWTFTYDDRGNLLTATRSRVYKSKSAATTVRLHPPIPAPKSTSPGRLTAAPAGSSLALPCRDRAALSSLPRKCPNTW